MLAAIVVGVWAMILFSALLRGMLDEMVAGGLRALPGEAQIHHPAYRDDPSVDNSMPAPSGELLAALNTPPIENWAGRVRVSGMILSERDSRGAILLGVDPAAEIALGFKAEDIVDGRFLDSPQDKGLVIGRKLAERLETDLGKRVVIMAQGADNEVAERGVRIVGIYRARLQATEELFVYTGLAPLQNMLGMGEDISELAITAGAYQEVDRWLPAISRAAGPELDTQPWTTLDAYLYSIIRVQGNMNIIIMIVIFLALSFGLVNTLVMALFERVREIGLMMALGMRPAWIMYQVLMESLLLLVLGLVIGNLLALLTIIPLQDGIDISMVAEGLEMAGMGTTLYPALAIEDMWMATAVVLSLGILASIFPAWRASRLDPIKALAQT
jgi:ABC-type lipoprotein release transport system permease subunit